MGIYVFVQIEPRDVARWKTSELGAQYAKLKAVRGFDRLDMGDEDLLGGEITVGDQTTKEGALAFLAESGLVPDVDVRAEQTTMHGKPAIRLLTDGPLARDATVADLLAHLARAEDEHTEATWAKESVEVRGLVSSYDAYREYRLPVIYALGAAHDLGGSGRVSFIGGDDGETVTTYVATNGKEITITETDPQNLTEESWDARAGGMAATDASFAAWKKTKKKKKKQKRGRKR